VQAREIFFPASWERYLSRECQQFVKEAVKCNQSSPSPMQGHLMKTGFAFPSEASEQRWVASACHKHTNWKRQCRRCRCAKASMKNRKQPSHVSWKRQYHNATPKVIPKHVNWKRQSRCAKARMKNRKRPLHVSWKRQYHNATPN
jgi:hypothetical protein